MTMRKYVLLAGLFCFALGGIAEAGETRLTESLIKEFYAKSAIIHTAPYETYYAFMDRHFHDLYRGEFKITHNIKGVPPQKQVMPIDKEQYLKYAEQEYKTTSKMDVENKVMKVKLSDDGQDAFVKDVSFMSGKLDVPAPQGMISMYVEIKGVCADRVILNKGVIQVLQSKCHIENDMVPMP